jgi:uncharacterized protein YdgA (DUF945 family)
MSTRTRLCLLAAAAIILGYPLSAWIIGFIVEGQLHARLQQGLQQAGPYLATQRTYQRGVFGASEMLTVTLKGRGMQSAAALSGLEALASSGLTVRNTIHHGPFPGGRTFALATLETEVILPPDIGTRVNALFAGKNPLRMHTTLDWLGGSQTELTIPAFNGELARTSVSSSGLTGTATSSRGMRSITFNFDVKTLSLSGAQFNARLDDLRLRSALQSVIGTLRVGDIAFTVGHVEARGTGADSTAPLSVQNAQISSHSSATGDYISYSVKLATGPVRVARFTATQELYEFTGTHVYGPSLAALRDNLRAASNAATNQQSQQQLTEAWRKDGIDLLLHHPRIEIPHFDFTTPEGALTLSASVTAPGLKREELEGGGPALMAALVQHLEAQADARIDTGLLDKLTEGTPGNGDRLATAARQLEAQGYIAHEGTALLAHLKFDHGKLSLNGKAFPPSRAGP